MRKKPNGAWYFYQFDPTSFHLDRRIRKLDGLDIAILRTMQDAMWQSGEQRIVDDVNTIAAEIDISATQLEGTIDRLLKSKALYSLGGFLYSPHIDDCWNYCLAQSEKKRRARLKGLEKQRETNNR